jgi:exopolyphosphatase/guanosine-5'-triphosphate,3'-diphosphate pyrophosphatase
LTDFHLTKNISNSFLDGSIDRLGVIDIGSNSVRLVIFDGAVRSPAYFYNEKVLCALGDNLGPNGELNNINKQRALSAIKRFVMLAQSMNSNLRAIATAAIRNAPNGQDFCLKIHKETGLKVVIATGEEEARLSAEGVLLGWPESNGIVCDLGGASMELAEISNGEVGVAISSPLGPLILDHVHSDPIEKRSYIRAKLIELRKVLRKKYKSIYLVGGSWRTIARMQMEISDYPLKVLHEYQISIEDAKKTTDWIRNSSIEKMSAVYPSSKARLKLLSTSAIILEELIESFQPKNIAMSSYGIREGLLYGSMEAKLKNLDPLLEACQHMENSAARIPGFGLVLFSFIKPIFDQDDLKIIRLVKAACLLHDVTWRAHPDYRAEVCFDNATRANLGGLDHSGRIFLAFALLYRYKSLRNKSYFKDFLLILKKNDLMLAKTLGKAMRFGAMLSGSTNNTMGELKLFKDKNVLQITISKNNKDLFGEVVQLRFSNLAESLGCKASLVVQK